MKNAEDIRSSGVDDIFLAYKNGVSLPTAWKQIDVIRSFRGYGLPRSVPALKAAGYISKARICRTDYVHYLKNCEKLGLDLADTKVAFPRQFKRRQQVMQDQVDAIIRAENAEKIAAMNRQLEAIAKTWSSLERNGRDYRIVIPRTEQEFIDAGRAMANCLGQYASRVSRGELVVVFVRQAGHPRKAFVAAAYDPKAETVTQCYGGKNSKPPKPVTDFVNRVFAGVKSKKQLKVAA